MKTVPVTILFYLFAIAQQTAAVTGNDLLFPTLATDRRLLALDPDGGPLKVVASNTVGTGSTTFREMRDVTSDGRLAYVTDFIGNAVFEVDLASGDRRVIPGISLTKPDKITLFRARGRSGLVISSPDSGGVADGIYVYTFDDRQLARVAFGFGSIDDIAVDLNGVIYIADARDRKIRSVDPFSGARVNFATTGVALDSPIGISFYSNDTLLIADVSKGILKLDVQSGVVETVSKSGVRGAGPVLSTPSDVEVDGDRQIFAMTVGGADAITRIDMADGNRTPVAQVPDVSGKFSWVPRPTGCPEGIEMSGEDGNLMFKWRSAPRVPYQLQGSFNLKDWFDIGSPSLGLRELNATSITYAPTRRLFIRVTEIPWN